MKSHRISFAIVASLLGVVMFNAPAAADDDGSWQLTIAPYVWLTSFDGKIAVRDEKHEIDASFSDILDASDSILAFNADVKARFGRFGLLFAPTYMQMGVDDVANGTILESDFTTDLLFIDAAAFYRLADWDMTTKSGEETSATLDVYGGLRYSSLSVELDRDAGGSPDADKDWLDPIIGADANVDICPSWFYSLRADVGGFGVNSEFATNAITAIGWRFNVLGIDAALRAGYRVMYEDYDHGGFQWRMTIHGPILGLMTTWG
jgi:hypothetical protein